MKQIYIVAAAFLAVLLFAPAVSAQYGGYCPDTCIANQSCDIPCTECVIFGYDYCALEQEATCGTGGGQCEGCLVTNRWTETTRTKTLNDPFIHCLGREYWYLHYTNWSQYRHYDTTTTHTTYETTDCWGTGVSTRVVQVTYDYGDCYELYDTECFYGQTQESDPDVHGRECYF